jgi:Ser/Thr protein kinase RdoA (MazF antagonist)
MHDRGAAPDLRALGALFQVPGTWRGAVPYGSGHINDTYAATYDQAGAAVRYIHQRINGHVFRQPVQLMENVARVLSHTASRLEGVPDADRRVLTLVPARDGRPYVIDEAGAVWRTYRFIEHTRTHDIVETPAQAEVAARAFGQFQALLADLPGARLHDTIPDFHHTRRRFDACAAAIAGDPCNRALDARDATAFALAREADADRLLDAAARGEVPERVTHNDTKINNVLMDATTGEALCVVDLDTTMPGLVAYDFGDMVRTATNVAAEDEPDPTRVHSRPEMFEALVRGYLSSAGSFLTQAEIAWLPFAGLLLAYEQGLRFLSDHLQGDTYYPVRRPGHNLERARAQFALVTSIERQMDAYEAIVRRYARG